MTWSWKYSTSLVSLWTARLIVNPAASSILTLFWIYLDKLAVLRSSDLLEYFFCLVTGEVTTRDCYIIPRTRRIWSLSRILLFPSLWLAHAQRFFSFSVLVWKLLCQVAPSPISRCSSYWKGSFRVTLIYSMRLKETKMFKFGAYYVKIN